MRPEHDPVIGQRGGGLRELDRGVGVVALADADGDGLAGVPLLLFRLEALLLPFLRRQHTLRFAGIVLAQVDSGTLAETDAAL